ncbi:MAG: APC family permease [Candidatus Eremiobacteraeota bacterium]|nr:APC family permease [Candidatus Eremiobacteraeota bacterium]
MGPLDAVLFFIVASANLQWIAAAAVTGPSSLTVWLIGGAAMFVPLSVVVVSLSRRYPDEGGLYVWSKRAFGPFAGFMTGWTYWASNLPYFPALLYFTASNALFMFGSKAAAALGASPAFFIAVAIGGLALGTIVNVFGLDIGKWLNDVGAASRWIVTLALIAVGAFVLWHFGSATTLTAATMRPALSVKDLIFWSTIAFAWTGPEAIAFMAGEVRDPRRTIPRALGLAAPAIAAIYIAGTASVLVALPAAHVSGLTGVMQAIAAGASRFGWFALTPIAALLVVVSCLGSVGAWLGAVARLPFVAGIDRYLPPVFGRMHPRWGSPVAALWTQSAIAAVFILLGQGGTSVKGAYDVLVSTTVIITFIPFIALFASAIRLRGGEAPREIGIPGGRVTVIVSGVIGLLTTAASIVLATIPPDDEPNKALAVLKVLGLTAVMVAGGMALYASGRRRERAASDLPDLK